MTITTTSASDPLIRRFYILTYIYTYIRIYVQNIDINSAIVRVIFQSIVVEMLVLVDFDIAQWAHIIDRKTYNATTKGEIKRTFA